MNTGQPENRRLALSISEFCKALNIGRTLAYQLIGQGKLRTVTIGGRRLVPMTEIQRLLEQHAD